MEEKKKIGGRGLRLLEAMKSRVPGSSSEASTSEQSSPVAQPEGSEKKTVPQFRGRGSLLAKIQSHLPQSQQPQSAVESATTTKTASGPKGRGFLAQIAKQSRMKDSGVSSQVPKSPQGKGEHVSDFVRVPASIRLGTPDLEETSVEGKLEQLSLKTEEEDIEMPPIIKRGEIGEKINICANYVTLNTAPGKGVFEFEVRFSPEIDYVAFRRKLINQHFKCRRGIKCYDGGDKLYMPEKITEDVLMINTKHPNDESPVVITVKFKRQMRLKECSQLYNILFHNLSKILNMTRFGRQHFDHKQSYKIPQHKLEVWPGYITSVEEFEGGIHLCCDIRHRVLRTETAYDIITNFAKIDPANFKNSVLKELLGQCVITRYNNNLYRIDDVDWARTPMSTFKLSSGEDITFLEYYKKQYNLHISDIKQPLLINKPKAKDKDEKVQLICLIPELCHLTGLTDKMRKDMKVMKEIATYTRVTPGQRNLAFRKFLENIKNNEDAQQMLGEWGLKMADFPLQSDARILPTEDIILKNRTRLPAPVNVEWSKYLRNHGVLRFISLRHWLLLHTNRDTALANAFWNMLVKVSPGLGLDICDPTLVPLKDDRIDSYIRGLSSNLNPKIQMVVCLCPTSRDDRYAAIKKFCCRDTPIPSQVINCGTIARENRMRSVVQNVALQINNKLGGAAWGVHVPLKNTMVCGIDSYHDVNKRGNSVGAFVASFDDGFTQWYSKTCIQDPRQELIDGLVCCFSLSLKKYLEVNNILPERIVIFRDGVGDGQLQVVQKHEVQQFLETCQMVSKSYKPKLSFIVVQKRINTKFYLSLGGSGDNLENPRSGSVLDHTVTRRNYYDFFLVSQHVSCGTATPSHYIVLYDTTELRPDLMQRLTYKFCHMYFNWAGTVRVPAPCQYAHKLAYLVGQHIKTMPNEKLDDVLFYL